MTIHELIFAEYPELQEADLYSLGIVLRDDCDGLGAYLVSWDYSKPVPKTVKIGK